MKESTAGFSIRLLDISSPEDAEGALKRVKVDPAAIPQIAAKMITRFVHLGGITCAQAEILKQILSAMGGDIAVSASTVASNQKTDAVLSGTYEQLDKLCEKLGQKPFGLPALAAQLQLTLNNATTRPRIWRTAKREISLGRPLIMGILNVTPDSFSDGSKFNSVDKAVDRAWEMVEQGADIIDIGGESTRPGAVLLDAADEIARIMPVLERLSGQLPCPISIDTWKSTVAERAIDTGVEIINDISGFTFDPLMAPLAARTGAAAVLMHTRGRPDEMQQNTTYDDLLGEVLRWLEGSIAIAVAAGVQPERLAVDPGIGFGKDLAGNLELLRRLAEFRGLGLPILVGTSRKGFIGRIVSQNVDSRLHGTAATVAMAIANGAHIVRVHDVAEMRDVADMTHAILNG